MVSKHKEIIEEFIENIREALSNTSTAKELRKIQNEVRKMEGNIDKLINLYLSGVLDKEDFERKYNELTAGLDKVRAREEELQQIIRKENDLQDRINNFKKVFEGGQVLQEFDREVFEGMIEEIAVGSEEDGKVDPYTITFVFKTGLQIKKSDENKGLYSYSADDTCGDYSSNTKSRFLEVLNFRHFYQHYTFDPVDDLARNKQIKDYIMVAVVFRVDTVDTSAS
ncbi:MAG TPA: hypothetical protein PK192_09090 [Bacillota bacterium]|jgi:site-specific DNA recombinase|nr:hypothetical protein [Bacillota bacterium]